MVVATYFDTAFKASEAGSFIDLEWEIPTEGVVIVEGGTWTPYDCFEQWNEPWGPTLCAVHEGRPHWYILVPGAKTYRPMAERALHRTFADTEISLEGVRAFCEKYGLLKAFFMRQVDRPEGCNLAEDEPPPVGDSAMGAIRAVLSVRGLLYAFELVKQHGPEAPLARYFDSIQAVMNGRDRRTPETVRAQMVDWEPGEDDGGPPVVSVSVSGGNEDIYRSLIPGSPMICVNRNGTVQGFLQMILHTYLEQHCVGGVRCAGTPHLVLKPTNLLGAIYLHLALEVTGQTGAIRRCPSCQAWFEATHMRHIYCEPRCKTKGSRNRRKAQKV